jgi:pimeloyl-ACP methyl ester carboxylesterase
MQSGIVDANGQRLYYEIHGQGEPLLVISGLGGDIIGWGLQIQPWNKHFQVIVFDNRDAGRSSLAAGPYTIADMAADTVALLRALGIERAHVLGASMGGMIAQELALAHPDMVDKLVLVCTTAQMARYRLSLIDPWKWIVNNDPPAEIPSAYLVSWCMTHDFQQNAAAVEDLIGQIVNAPYPQSPSAFGRQADAVRGHDALDRLGGITAPTLVIVGDQDLLTPPWLARQLAAAIPGARLQILEGGGHCLFWEIADRFNQTVIDFLG